MVDDRTTPKRKDTDAGARATELKSERTRNPEADASTEQEHFGDGNSGLTLYLLVGILVTALALTSAWLLMNSDWDQTPAPHHTITTMVHQPEHQPRLHR